MTVQQMPALESKPDSSSDEKDQMSEKGESQRKMVFTMRISLG